MTPAIATILAVLAAGVGALIGYLLARVRAGNVIAQLQSDLAVARTGRLSGSVENAEPHDGAS